MLMFLLPNAVKKLLERSKRDEYDIPGFGNIVIPCDRHFSARGKSGSNSK